MKPSFKYKHALNVIVKAFYLSESAEDYPSFVEIKNAIDTLSVLVENYCALLSTNLMPQ